MVIATFSSVMTAHRQQRVRILAVAAEARSRAAPEHAGEFIKRELARWAPVITLALKPGA